MTTKVFVGNLAFQTTDQALAEAFQDCGRVKSGVVITRGRRSLGYGFVEFETPDGALEAVKGKNNTQLKGRTLKVELASDNPVRSIDRIGSNPDSRERGEQRERGERGERERGERGERERGERGERGENRPSSAAHNMSEPNPDGSAPRRRRRNNRRRRGGKQSGGENAPPRENNIPRDPSAPKPSGPPENPRGPRIRRRNPPNNEDRVLSKTAVFVANLPFNVNDAELLQFFKDNNAKAAHVVVTRNGRSRGYGFVDFEFEKDQQTAINTKHNVKFTDRIITVTQSYKTQEVTPEN
jgi:RNA recognition motif-containing protein